MKVASGSMNGSQPIRTFMRSATFIKCSHKILVGLPNSLFSFVVFAKVPAYRVLGRDFGCNCIKDSFGCVEGKMILFYVIKWFKVSTGVKTLLGRQVYLPT